MRGLARAIVTTLLLLAGILPALAHATLTGSSPPDGAVLDAAPPVLVLSFNEPVSPLTATLIRPGEGSGEPVELVANGSELTLAFDAGLDDGTYVVSWRAVSEDGHPIAGTSVFSIGQPVAAGQLELAPPSQPEVIPLLWASRLALYLGLFFGVGGAAFRILSPVLPRRARRLAVAASLVGAAAAVLVIGLQGLDALGLGIAGLADGQVWSTGLATVYGRTSLLALCAFAAALLALRLRHELWLKLMAAVGLVLLGLAVSTSGHASAAEPQWLMRPALFVHIVSIAWWVGALYPLVLLLRLERRIATPPLLYFSAAIPFAIVPLVASGIVLAVVQLGWPGPAWVSGYGAILAAKLALLVVLFAIASWNRWVLTAPAAAGDLKAVRHMRRGIVAELVLIAAILALVAGWRFTPPPRALAAAEQPAGAVLALAARNLTAELAINPARVGSTDVVITLATADGEPVSPRSVRLSLTPAELDLAPVTRTADADAEGNWRAEAVVLPLPGLWTVEVEVRVTDFELIKLTGDVTVAP